MSQLPLLIESSPLLGARRSFCAFASNINFLIFCTTPQKDLFCHFDGLNVPSSQLTLFFSLRLCEEHIFSLRIHQIISVSSIVRPLLGLGPPHSFSPLLPILLPSEIFLYKNFFLEDYFAIFSSILFQHFVAHVSIILLFCNFSHAREIPIELSVF